MPLVRYSRWDVYCTCVLNFLCYQVLFGTKASVWDSNYPSLFDTALNWAQWGWVAGECWEERRLTALFSWLLELFNCWSEAELVLGLSFVVLGCCLNSERLVCVELRWRGSVAREFHQQQVVWGSFGLRLGLGNRSHQVLDQILSGCVQIGRAAMGACLLKLGRFRVVEVSWAQENNWALGGCTSHAFALRHHSWDTSHKGLLLWCLNALEVKLLQEGGLTVLRQLE